MCKHSFHFIHEMHYSSIAYFQGVMTGKGVKREIGAWPWQEARPDPLYFLEARPDPLYFLNTNCIGWVDGNETLRG
ncbi:hypothetical protein EU509_20560 [Pseudoalteromonas fuliginea]|uniref:Uncharacterized protein n=1 Tax=Pseudoalteromonas fuliginea TaxID=1872678 RepID=A0ABQ6RDE1_9GAMM|nr:hypothetical protein EU509_20560 [Pseudoalteromonas fuliginea]KAA1165237.1 hypothetical protein EUZ79_20545 [Pseudoalteromonas fuliginea]